MADRPAAPDAAIKKPQTARWLILAVALVAAIISWSRAARVTYDFHHFYLDAAYVWKHGELNPALDDPTPAKNRQLPFYLPTVSVLIAPSAAGGHNVAAILWALMQVASLAYCLRVLAGWCSAAENAQLANARFAWLVLLSLAALYEATKFNQVSYLTLAFLLAGANAIEKKRDFAGGCWIAAAAVLKLLPAAFAVWLVLHRRWRGLAGFVVGCAILVAIPPLAAFGPQRTLQYHREWWRFNVRSGGLRSWLEIDNPGPFSAHFVDRRNQSIGAVLARIAIPDHPRPAAWQPLRLTADQALRIASVVTALLGLALLVAIVRRSPPGESDAKFALRCDFALLALGIQVLAPLTRMYYLVWTMPALALLLVCASPPEPVTNRRALTIARIGLLAWVLGMLAWPFRDLRDFGVHSLMLMVIGVCVALLRNRESETVRR